MLNSELIELLEDQDPDMLVYLARDAEGNGFRILDQVTTEDFKQEDEDLEIERNVPAVVLWPSY